MPDFIFTVEAQDPKTNKTLDISHWTVTARSTEEADKIMQGRANNANRTVPSVFNLIRGRETHARGVCVYLDRGLHCSGHPIVEPLKQERRGNEREFQA